MTRHRAQRLVAVAKSKGVKAKYYASAPRSRSASSPLLYSVVLVCPRHRHPAWCFNTEHFFATLRGLLARRQECKP